MGYIIIDESTKMTPKQKELMEKYMEDNRNKHVPQAELTRKCVIITDTEEQ